MTQREGYEAWFRASYGQEPIPRTSPAHDFCWAGYKAGASSRDEEVAKWRDAYEKAAEAALILSQERDQLRDAEVVSLTNQRDYEYVRAENAEQERDQFEQERDQLREHVTLLRDVVGHVAGMRFSIVTTKMCEAALAATEPKE